jgi:hypothetical protein
VQTKQNPLDLGEQLARLDLRRRELTDLRDDLVRLRCQIDDVLSREPFRCSRVKPEASVTEASRRATSK